MAHFLETHQSWNFAFEKREHETFFPGLLILWTSKFDIAIYPID